VTVRSPVRIGIIGCGSIARSAHVPGFLASPHAELAGFASRTRGSAEATAEGCGSPAPIYDDWRELVEREDVDAVAICSPNAFHREQAVTAAKAGKHVLVEKPVAVSADEADEMIAAATEAGVVLQVAHNLRYVPSVLAARDAVGRVGSIVGLRAAFGHGGPQVWAKEASWFFDRARSGGGALIDMGIHIIDVVNFVTGLDAREVTAMMAGNDPCEDAAQLVVSFDNNAIGSVHASWVARPAPDMSLTIFGSDGTLHFDVRTPLTFRPADGKKEQIELPTVNATPFDDFARIASGEAAVGPAASGEEARKAIAIVDAAYESARSGDRVKVA
jgi:UDP-N-acetylglucosamine 3-dehydrogenase